MIERELPERLVRTCDYCNETKEMKIMVSFEVAIDYFCSTSCRDLYFKQYEGKVKV